MKQMTLWLSLSLRGELNDVRASHIDLDTELRCTNTITFLQAHWRLEWIQDLCDQVFSLGYEPVGAPPPPPRVP